MPLLHLLKKEVSGLVSSLCSDFMLYSLVRETDICKINLMQEQHCVPLKNICNGIAAADTFNSITKAYVGENHSDLQLFLTHCREFLFECVNQIHLRFHDLDRFDFLKYLSPSTACNLKVPSLLNLLKEMPYPKDIADMQTVNGQHAMCSAVSRDMRVQGYWFLIFRQKNSVVNRLYPNFFKIIAVLFTFSFSNSLVERVFSQLKMIKRDHRTALKHRSLLFLLTSKLWLQQSGTHVAAAF